MKTTVVAGLKNWQTTLIGFVLAVLLVMQSNDLSNWKEWVVPALIAGLSFLIRDAGTTSENSGIKLLIIGMMCMFFVSCVSPQYVVNTVPYTKQIEANPEKVLVDKKDVTPVGGFQATIGGTVITDQGEITLSPDGVEGNVVVDLRSGK